MAESGFPGFEYELWQGLFAPARTARPIIEQVSQEVERAAELPEAKNLYAAQSLVYRSGTPEEFDRFVHAEVAKLKNVVKVAGLKIQ